MMTRLRGRVERLEGSINTSSKTEKHKAWQAASDDAFHLGYEALVLSILDMDHWDVLRRLRRFCEGENVKVLTAVTLDAIGGAFGFRGDDRVDLTVKHLREEVPPERWEYRITGEQFKGGLNRDLEPRERESGRPLLRQLEEELGPPPTCDRELAGETAT